MKDSIFNLLKVASSADNDNLIKQTILKKKKEREEKIKKILELEQVESNMASPDPGYVCNNKFTYDNIIYCINDNKTFERVTKLKYLNDKIYSLTPTIIPNTMNGEIS